MSKSIIELFVGSLDDKRAYRQLRKRVKILPKDYRYAFKRMQKYLYYTDLSGCDETLFANLIELLETSAAQNRAILDVVGSDVAAFCDELVEASLSHGMTSKEKLNKEIQQHFQKEGRKA